MKVGSFDIKSRLIIGTGKYANFDIMKKAHEASGADVVTIALRRVNLNKSNEDSILNYIPDHITLLPNTAGCFTAEDAIRTAELAEAAGLPKWIKLEVIGDTKTLMPDNAQTIAATKILVEKGWTVLAYCSDDIVACKQLEDAGAAAVMPLGAPIGSGQGILNSLNIKLILEQASVPIIVDAGVGTASDAAIAMELGAEGVLLNTAVAAAQDPVKMAAAMKYAVEAGRLAFEAGRMAKKPYATASTSMDGISQ